MYHVRFNAAQSLYKLGLNLETDLADVLNGPDRYARDMLLYRWEMEKRRKEYSERRRAQQQAAEQSAEPTAPGGAVSIGGAA